MPSSVEGDGVEGDGVDEAVAPMRYWRRFVLPMILLVAAVVTWLAADRIERDETEPQSSPIATAVGAGDFSAAGSGAATLARSAG